MFTEQYYLGRLDATCSTAGLESKVERLFATKPFLFLKSQVANQNSQYTHDPMDFFDWFHNDAVVIEDVGNRVNNYNV